MIVCAGNGEEFEFAISIGVGLIDSTMSLNKICLMNPPKFILFIGSCGSYGEKEIFDIVSSQSSSNIENSFFNANSFTPIDNIISTSNDVSRETIVNSSNYITRDKSLGKSYLSHGIGIENMEFFSVMRVAQEFGIPAGGVFVVTNYCDENAHTDFIHNHARAKELLSEYILSNKDDMFKFVTKSN
jgi:nucleoside phosphorylase